MVGKFLGALVAIACALPVQATPIIAASDLRDFEKLPEARKKLIEAALRTHSEVSGMPYLYGGNGAASGGFDCSGAIYAVLRQAGLKPPRTSSDQYLWIRDQSKLHPVSIDVENIAHPSFESLAPGDLVFWSGTYEPPDDRLTPITHVALFLGFEKKDGRAVMINATNGRTYRGTKVDGYGVCDFRVPRKGGKSRLVADGTPPGILGK